LFLLLPFLLSPRRGSAVAVAFLAVIPEGDLLFVLVVALLVVTAKRICRCCCPSCRHPRRGAAVFLVVALLVVTAKRDLPLLLLFLFVILEGDLLLPLLLPLSLPLGLSAGL
jgi:hypothetical protein